MSAIIEVIGGKVKYHRPKINPGYYINMAQLIYHNSDLRDNTNGWIYEDQIDVITNRLNDYFVKHKVHPVEKFLEDELPVNYKATVLYSGYMGNDIDSRMQYWEGAAIEIEDLENPINYDTEENIKTKLKIFKETIKL